MCRLLFTLFLFSSTYVFSVTPSGLPIPRFVSLRSSEVNLRVGPGDHFPTEWVYQRVNFPLEIIAEFGDWRKVRDLDGAQGWIHKSLLSGHLYVLITKDQTALKASNNSDAHLVARLQNGVIGKLLKCKEGFCQIEVRRDGTLKGWVSKQDVWGVEAQGAG
jgi:SH3-like domain-containing protein